MKYTLKEFLESGLLPEYEIMTKDGEYGSIPIETISVQEFPFDNFIQPNELVLSTALGCEKNESRFLSLIYAAVTSRAAALILTFKDPGVLIPPSVISYAESENFPIIVIPWHIRFSDIQNAVHEKIREKRFAIYHEIQTILFNLYFDSQPLESALEAICRTFQVNAAITDLNGKVLSGNQPDSDWPVKKIFINHLPVGQLMLHPKKSPSAAEIPPIEWELIEQYICFPLSLWFNKKNIEDMTTLRLKNDFVWDLAQKTDTPRAEQIRQGAQLHFDLNLPYTCALFRAVLNGQNEFTDEYSSETMSAGTQIEDFLIQESKASRFSVMIASRNLDFLLYVSNPKLSPEKVVPEFLSYLHRRLSEAFPKYGFWGGMSEISLKPSDFPRLYQNAALALQCCLRSSNRTRRCFTYEDTKEAQIVSVFANNEVIRKISEETLSSLQKYGSEANMDLLETLAVFIRCNYNVALTARTLHIHRQSLLYRLEKISNLTGLALNDHQNLFLLEVSLRTFSLYP